LGRDGGECARLFRCHLGVQRLEQARRTPRSPIEQAYGSLDAWEAEAQVGIDSGTLDAIDMPAVILSVRRWHREGVFAG
jgi:hypothetical protein